MAGFQHTWGKDSLMERLQKKVFRRTQSPTLKFKLRAFSNSMFKIFFPSP